jgi:hypothetical protein
VIALRRAGVSARSIPDLNVKLTTRSQNAMDGCGLRGRCDIGLGSGSSRAFASGGRTAEDFVDFSTRLSIRHLESEATRLWERLKMTELRLKKVESLKVKDRSIWLRRRRSRGHAVEAGRWASMSHSWDPESGGDEGGDVSPAHYSRARPWWWTWARRFE